MERIYWNDELETIPWAEVEAWQAAADRRLRVATANAVGILSTHLAAWSLPRD